MTPGPESYERPGTAELPPEKLAELKEAIEFQEILITNLGELVEESDQSGFPGPDEEASTVINPAVTDIDPLRAYWNESEWPQVMKTLADRYGFSAGTVDGTGIGDELVVGTFDTEYGAVEISVIRGTDAAGPGEVPYLPVMRRKVE